MAAFLGNRVFDNGLSVLSNDSDHNLILVDGEGSFSESYPTTYTEVNDNQLGVYTDLSISDPQDRDDDGGGREVVVSDVVEGDITDTGQAKWWAIVDTNEEDLLALQELDQTQTVTSGNLFNLDSFKIGIPDPSDS